MSRDVRPARVCIVDDSYRGLNPASTGLSRVWLFGTGFGDFDLVIRATRWSQVVRDLDAFTRAGVGPRRTVRALHVWGHGDEADPRIGQTSLRMGDNLIELGLAARMEPDGYVWFRMCDVFRGRDGKAFAYEVANVMRCGAVGHTRVVSKGRSPLDVVWQSGGRWLMPGESPWWDESDRGFSGRGEPNTCFFTDMNPDPSWRRPATAANLYDR